MKFKVGDEVVIIKPSYIVYSQNYTDSSSSASQAWVDIMDAEVGKKYTLSYFVNGNGWEVAGWWYLEDWLVLVKSANNPSDTFDDAMSIV